MHKFYLWSNILNSVIGTCIELSDTSSIITYAKELALAELTTEVSNNYYKFLSLNVVRTGSPYYNIINPIESYPYSINSDLEQNNIFLDALLSSKLNINLNTARLIIQSEYNIWNYCKSQLKNTDINFIKINQFYETDVLTYCKQRALIDTSSYCLQELDYVSTPFNEFSSSKKMSYAVSALDSILTSIK